MKLFEAARKYGAKAAVAVSTAALTMGAMAQTAPANPADAITALNSLSGTTTSYGPPLFGLAVVASGILIGVAWIKKSRGAAK